MQMLVSQAEIGVWVQATGGGGTRFCGSSVYNPVKIWRL